MDTLISPLLFEKKLNIGLRSRAKGLAMQIFAILWSLPFSAAILLLQKELPLWPATLPAMHPLTWIYFLSVVPISIYLSVAVHELGHALIARLLGYQIYMITIGMLGITNELNGWRVRRVGSNLLAVRGNTIALSTSSKLHRSREFLVLSGGIIAQSLLLWVLISVSHSYDIAKISPLLTALVHSLALITFAGLCGSVIPVKMGQTETDAYQMVQMARSGERVARRLQLQRVTGRCLSGLPYEEIDPAILHDLTSVQDGSRQEYAANLLAYLHTYRKADLATATTALNRALNYVLLHSEMRSATWPFLYAAEFELTSGRGADFASRWLALVKEDKYSFLAIDFQQMKSRLESTLMAEKGEVFGSSLLKKQSMKLVGRRIDRAAAATERKHLQASQLSEKLTSAQKTAREQSSPRWNASILFHQFLESRGMIVSTTKTLVGFALLCILFSAVQPVVADASQSIAQTNNEIQMAVGP